MFFLLTFIKPSFIECKVDNLVSVEIIDIDSELDRLGSTHVLGNQGAECILVVYLSVDEEEHLGSGDQQVLAVLGSIDHEYVFVL